MLRDLRLAARSLSRAPGFAFTAVVSLGIAIAGSASAFSVLDAIRFRALPFRDGERLVLISEVPDAPLQPAATPQRTECRTACSVAYDTWAQVIQRHRFESLDAVTAFTSGLKALNTNAESTPVDVGIVTSNTFGMLGAAPILGRAFLPDDDRLGAPLVTVMSHDVWQTHFASDPGVVGSTVKLSDSRYVVIGVMPPGFRFESGSGFWLPAVPTLDPSTRPSIRHINVVGRLAPGRTIDQLRQELRHVQTLAATSPRARDERTVLAAEPLRTRYVAATRSHDVVFAGIVGCLLLIASANLASLILVRALHQREELAVRTALGASSWRVSRGFLAQNAIVVAMSVALGLMLATVTVKALTAIAAFDTLRAEGMDSRIDWRVTAFTILVGALLTILLTLLPVRLARSTNLQTVLREGASGASGARVRTQRLFVSVQVAFTLVLLVGGALMARSALTFATVPLGFETATLISGTPSYPHPWRVPEKYLPVTEEIATRLAAIPGVASVALRASLPLPQNALRVEGSAQPLARGTPGAPNLTHGVSPGYFATIGVRVIAGREFAAQDVSAGAPVAIVNQWAARHWWPGQNAVGRTLSIDTAPGQGVVMTVVGVVADNRAARGNVLLAEDGPELYRPYLQAHSAFPSFLVRAGGSPGPLMRPVRETLLRLVPDRPLFTALPSETIARQLRGARVTAAQVLAFAAAGMVLALVGIYGVLAYEVSQRRREIGIRTALGASRGRIVGVLLLDAARLALVGIAIGVPAAMVAMRVLTDAVYPTKPNDPLVFAIVASGLFLVALVAAAVPAWRAGRIDPVVVMKGN